MGSLHKRFRRNKIQAGHTERVLSSDDFDGLIGLLKKPFTHSGDRDKILDKVIELCGTQISGAVSFARKWSICNKLPECESKIKHSKKHFFGLPLLRNYGRPTPAPQMAVMAR